MGQLALVINQALSEYIYIYIYIYIKIVYRYNVYYMHVRHVEDMWENINMIMQCCDLLFGCYE